jgi:hypothetical protein
MDVSNWTGSCWISRRFVSVAGEARVLGDREASS